MLCATAPMPSVPPPSRQETYASSEQRGLAEVDVVVNAAGVYVWWLPDPNRYTDVNAVGAENVARAVADAAPKAGPPRRVQADPLWSVVWLGVYFVG